MLPKDRNNDNNIGKTVGDYVIQSYLSKGAYSLVYKGIHTKNQTLAAIKIIRKNCVPNFEPMMKELVTEVSIMKKFNHPNIIGVLDFMETSSNVYIVIQFCNNQDLQTYLQRNGLEFVIEEQGVYFLRQIASAFAALTAQNIVHRDFKLTNLCVNNDTLIVCDLGAGMKLNPDSYSQEFVGTPSYCAPELVELYGNRNKGAKGYNSKVDLWAIGVSYYKLLFGKLPFKKCPMNQLRKVIHENAGPNLVIPREVNYISEESEDLLRRMLTEDPQQRISWKEFFTHPLFDRKDFNIVPSHEEIPSPGIQEYFFFFLKPKKQGARKRQHRVTAQRGFVLDPPRLRRSHEIFPPCFHNDIQTPPRDLPRGPHRDPSDSCDPPQRLKVRRQP
jgi:serine/threonine-protein kinase ULK/ATG1